MTDTKQMPLKPCPFCGTEPVETGSGHIAHHRIGCFLSALGGSTRLEPNRTDPSLWNRRADLMAPTDADREKALADLEDFLADEGDLGWEEIINWLCAHKATIRAALAQPMRFDVAKVRDALKEIVHLSNYQPGNTFEMLKRCGILAEKSLSLIDAVSNTPAAGVTHICLDLAKGEDWNGMMVSHDKTMTVAPQWLADFVAKHLHDPEPPAAEVPEVTAPQQEAISEAVEALERLIADCGDYAAWQRPCLAVDLAEIALAKLKAARVEKPAGEYERGLEDALSCIPGGSICDPQEIADALRAKIAAQSTGKERA